MILTVAIILIAILIGFTIYQYNLRRDLQRSISVITQYMTREQDDFKPLLYRTDNQELQGMITSINTLLLLKDIVFPGNTVMFRNSIGQILPTFPMI